MPVADEEPAQIMPVEDPANGSAEPASLLSASMGRALELARDRLLDRSLRNRLISTPLRSTKARQVRIYDELSDQVFAHLQGKKIFTFQPSKSGKAVDADDGDAEPVWAPDTGNDPDRHSDNKLQTQMTPEGLQKRLLSLFYEGQTLEEEQGVNVLFVALGFLEWREAVASDVERFAPLILVPVDLVRDGAKDRFKLLIRDEDLMTNVSLQAWLKDQFQIQLPEIPDADEWLPSTYMTAVEAAIAHQKNWKVHKDEILLGFFSFSKFLLWRDLDPENWGGEPQRLLDSPLLKRLLLRDENDDQEPDVPVVGSEERIDEVFSPAELIHVADADSSQAIAIQEVMAGKSLVIQGPPGTGKSQTITNIIAGAVARGKRVLFIAEKMEALNVVHDRLVKRKLGPICLELHSRKASKAQVLAQIKDGQKAAAPPKWSEAAFDELMKTQERLRGSSDRLHHTLPGRYSAFELMGEISLLKGRNTPTPDFKTPAAANWTPDQLVDIKREAQQVADRLATCGVPASHPWRGVGMKTPDVLVQDRLRPFVNLCRSEAQTLAETVSGISLKLDVPGDPSLSLIAAWETALGIISRRPTQFDNFIQLDGCLDAIGPLDVAAKLGREHTKVAAIVQEAFRAEARAEDWTAARRHLATHAGSLLRWFSVDYRRTVATLRGVWNGNLPKLHRERLSKLDALIDLQRLEAEIEAAGLKIRDILGNHWMGTGTDWSALEGLIGWLRQALTIEKDLSVVKSSRLIDPAVANTLLSQLTSSARQTSEAFESLGSQTEMNWSIAFDCQQFFDVPVSLLLAAAIQWAETFEAIVDWTAARDGLAWLRSLGCEELATRAFDGRVVAEQLEAVLMLSVYEAMWTELQKLEPELEVVLGDELSRLVERFRKADLDRIRIASDQVARAHLDRHPAGNAGPVGILADEARKARNLMAVRKLMLKAGDAIQRFKPVFLMSPLSVAQYLQPGALEFDLLVVDEASQVRPEDALGAIARCKQLVVVGDDRQLPPTNFFNRMINDEGPGDSDDDPEDEGGVRRASVKDVESILNLCSRFPSRMLKWHYRSEHPALIATSNRHFYDGALMLPPSVLARTSDGETGLLFNAVPEGGYERGKTARNELEAELIAQACLRHAREHPDLSLGIGTFSVAQRDCVRDRIDDLARKHPELEALMKERPDREKLFVKNLENIQGDERDVIFISIGYGRDANGKLTQNFGPVGRDGGERRLNVLITRARKRCEVFSSIVAEDIRLEGAGKPGVRALKEFLSLAKEGYSAISMATDRGFDSPFEEAVAATIRKLGYEVQPQVGMAGFFIDLAVVDPRDDGRYLLGIECDGAAYHSSRYARDRDRLRQEILESRGWKLHRVWSTDWFYKPDRETQKLKEAIERASQKLPGTKTARSPASEESYTPIVEPDVINEPELEETEEGPHSQSGLPPYQIADLRVRSTPIKPQELSVSQLAYWTTQIVAIEQPIHGEEVGRRLAAICGFQRTGNQIQNCAAQGLRAAKRNGDLVQDGDFWNLSAGGGDIPRDRSNLQGSEPVRKPALIAPSEFEAAALHAIRQSLALSDEDLVIETARLLGFARVGTDVRAAIRAVIDKRIAPSVDRDHLGRLRLKGV